MYNTIQIKICDKFARQKCHTEHLASDAAREKAKEDPTAAALDSGALVAYHQIKKDVDLVRSRKAGLLERFVDDKDYKFNVKVVEMTEKCVKEEGKRLGVSLSL